MKKLIFLVIFIQRMCYADISSLQNGIGITDKNIYTIAPTSIEYAIARKVHRLAGDDGVSAFINIPDIVRLYSISRKLNLYLTKFDTREVLGNWPITPWPNHYYIQAEDLAMYRADITDENRLNQRTPERLPDYIRQTDSDWKDSKGCLGVTPLRYGDIDGDGENELVIIKAYDIIVFSPEREKIVFSMHYWLKDEITAQRAKATFTEISLPDQPQFKADSGTSPVDFTMYPGWRSVSKLFDSEFDGVSNGADGYDLVLWRKVFDSNLNSEEVGFHKVADVLVHYTKVDGEYSIVETEQSVIKRWLSENNLTWSKGYPSTSECPGEEGQLIPEMHDPLLNDPEVLQ